MIGKDEIAEACRSADALSEEHQDMPGYWHERGVDIDGLTYVAMQRGLRVVMIEKGINPNQQHAVGVSLTRAEQQRQMRYASCFMDGFAARDRVRLLTDDERRVLADALAAYDDHDLEQSDELRARAEPHLQAIERKLLSP